MTEIAENLRLVCSYRPSISHVGRDLGINRSQLNRYLAGSSTPRPALLRKICDYFGVEPYEMMLPPRDFAEIVRVRGLDEGTTNRRLRQHFDRVMALGDARVRNLTGMFFEYYYSMSQKGKVIRGLIVFSVEDGRTFYRRLERMGPHDRPGRRHYRYQGAALVAGDRVFMSDYEYGAGIELTQTVLYPDYALRWTRLHGVKLGVSADQAHMPCSVRVYLERIPARLSLTGALRACGLFDPGHPEIPPHVPEMIDNSTSGPYAFDAYARR
ncbi:helix-turn-helix transcriptional regulator [Tistrella mobilis]|uniref:helix-turn-helix domain-containing protein n=1 Tax=Tistrella mobilis TaxID=171437 RepID=UPI003557CDDD